LPSVTRQPATLPTLVMLNTSRIFGIAEEGLAQFRREQARHRRLHVIHEVVDDVVVADFDTGLFGRGRRLPVGANVEADDAAFEEAASVTSDSVMPPTPASRCAL
jgi:hypothetical protein